MWRVAPPYNREGGLLAQDSGSNQKSIGYPKWAWFLAFLTFVPLVPMAVGKFIPSTRRYLGWLGVSLCSSSLLLLLTVVIAVTVPGDNETPQRARPSNPAPATVSQTISADTKTLILAAIQESPEVLDAAIGQDGSDVNLVLVVSSFTSEARAKELGDNFVRMTKAMSQDDPPTRNIGFGIYSYLVGVYYPDETLVAMGAKVQSSDHISW